MGNSSIYEISKITGFSPSTVSRALSHTGYCSEKAKKIIISTAEEIGFRPSSSARTLKSNRTNRILFCIPDICNPFYFDMIRGANNVFDQHGVYSMLCYTKHSLKEELKFVDLLMEHQGDGMIFVSFNFCDENIRAIQKSGRPTVLTNLYETPNQQQNGFDCVYVDHTKAMYIAAEHLIQQGHRDIALIIGSLEEQTGKERAAGFFSAMEKYGIPAGPGNLFLGDYTKESGCQAAQKVLAGERRFTAIITANDLMMVGAVGACTEKGVSIPQDLSVVSLDNTDFATAIYPRITSVDMMQTAIGETAASLLMERIELGREYPKIVRLEPQLIVRDSSTRPIKP